MLENMPVMDSIDELTQRWQEEASRMEDESVARIEKILLADTATLVATHTSDNKKQISSFAMRIESASRAPGPHPDMVNAHNMQRGKVRSLVDA